MVDNTGHSSQAAAPAAKPKQVPSLSRDVHYHHLMPDGSVANLAAKVVKTFPDGNGGVSCVNLHVFNDGYAMAFASWTQFSVCEASEYGQPGRWSWPPFVAPKYDGPTGGGGSAKP